MAHRRYRDPTYVTAVRHWTAHIARHGARCHERLCLYGDRTIPTGADRRAWDLAHDRATGAILGPAHRRCNRSEGARWQALIRAARTPHRPRTTPTQPRVSVNRW